MSDLGELVIEELTAGEARGEIGVKSLAEWRDFLATSGGTVPGPRGSRFPVSLERWKDAPDDTILKIVVQWVDPDLVGTFDTPAP
jgi:hypothetical protein